MQYDMAATGEKSAKSMDGSSPVGDESSESDGEIEPAKSFHRRLSTNRDIKLSKTKLAADKWDSLRNKRFLEVLEQFHCQASIKEGYLLKQTSFQRWRRRYFKLKGRKLYYAKDTKAVIFDEIELTDLCLAECSTKNVNHSFQVITPFRSLVLCAESRREMEEWLGALNTASRERRFTDAEPPECLAGHHHWYATSHARPTYCNVCREALGGVTSHGLSCEVCKCKVHKRCAPKALNNCKWTTLASIGGEIIEEKDGTIKMPHQWIEGNLPVSAKCCACDKTCGSVLRLQDWRCLWCRATVHTQCRPQLPPGCPLGPARVSVVPPTALHSVQDEAWEAVRPQASSPLLVFVNSKSGDNQGVKFLRRFKQLLNPAQVFDLISTGPRLGLKLFRHFDPFRILVCSGDGSVGWVLSEIDKLDMHKQCQVAVLPLGTGNDLARVLGWGSSCDDDTHLPQLLEKYERSSTKMLDRWSILAFERTIAMPKLSLVPGQPDGLLHSQIAKYEDNLVTHLHNILQSDDTSLILASAKRLCETVKDFAGQLAESSLTKDDDILNKKGEVLQQKLDLLLHTLTSDQIDPSHFGGGSEIDEHSSVKSKQEDTESEMSFDKVKCDKVEKDLSNFNFRKHRRTSRFVEREKDALIQRANSFKKAIRNLVEHTEQVVDEQNRQSSSALPTVKISFSTDLEKQSGRYGQDGMKMDSLKVRVLSSAAGESGSNSDLSSCPSPTSSVITARLANISPLPDERRDSTLDDPDLIALPVPPDFADSRRSSQVHQCVEETEILLLDTCATLRTIERQQVNEASSAIASAKISQESQRRFSTKSLTNKPDPEMEKDEEKECSSILSAISNEEVSIASEILDQKSFYPRKGSDGEDVNGHIGHIDSPETDTFPNSDPLQGESLMDDISSMLGETMYGFDQDSLETNTDESTLFPGETGELKTVRRKSLRNSIDKSRRSSKTKIDEDTQFGFENRAFIYMDNKTETEPKKYCSLAQFEEGSDIARRSFKKRPTTKISKTEANVNRQSTLMEEVDMESTPLGSNLHLNKIEKELSNVSTSTLKVLELDVQEKEDQKKDETKAEVCRFPQVCVVVEPPSPVNSQQSRAERLERLQPPEEALPDEGFDHLPVDAEEQFLTRSPAATRRISCCSMLSPADAAALAQAAGNANNALYHDEGRRESRREPEPGVNRKLPIINPLVRLPAWPNVSSGSGFISKCLLANADTLCAAVSPLIDPDETLLEGYYERCVMNNYFGIGIDAKISLDFHHKREEHPEKCRSRAKNYMWYGVLGSKQFLQKTYKNLEQRVQLECDGQRIPLPSLQGIVILNIPSFMGGINFWGGNKEDDIFLAPSFDDKILEVVAVFGSVQMAASRLINLQHHRIAQCHSIQINILGDEGVPIQVDGEAWIQPPGIIRILHKNRMQMLCRNRALENSLRAWEEKQRLSAVSSKPRSSITSHDKGRTSLTRQSMPGEPKATFLGVNLEKIRQHSFSGAVPVTRERVVTFVDPAPRKSLPTTEPEILFSDDEYHLLIEFIECSTTLIKWIKMLAISHPRESADLYSLCGKAEECLERVHPGGRILDGPQLREEFSKLVAAVKHLYEDSCCLLHDRGDKLKLREDLENKLSVSLANMEMELRKCVMYETGSGNLVYLQPAHDHPEHKRKGLFWLKFRSAKNTSSLGPSGKKNCHREVASWGTQEVATWLETLQLSEYIDSFVKNDIRGRELLTLARRDLKDLGVTKVGHVKRILQAIKDLNQGL